MRDLIIDTFPDLKIYSFEKLGEGLFATTWLINDILVAKVIKENTPNDYQSNEHMVLCYLKDKVPFPFPEIIGHKKTNDGTDILIEKRLCGDTFSYEKYMKLPQKTKNVFLKQYGSICKGMHSISSKKLFGRTSRTFEYQKQLFCKYYTDEIKSFLSIEEKNKIEQIYTNFLIADNAFSLVPVHGDMHFGNLIFDFEKESITGVLDFGSFQYADPAYEFRYLLGEPTDFLEKGYMNRLDSKFIDRQLFYCVCMFLMGIYDPKMTWVSAEQNIKRLRKLLKFEHMENAYLD